MKNTVFFMTFLAVILSIQTVKARDNFYDLPELTARIVDRTNTFSETEMNDLENLLEKYEKSSGNQMAVAFIDTTGGLTIEEYSIELAEKWKVGFKGKDNGIIILVAKRDRKMRIEVGYELEGTLTDLQSNLIINNVMVPNFRNNDYYSGIKGAILSIAELTGVDSEFSGEYGSMNSRTVTSPKISRGKSVSTIITIIIVLIFVVLSFISNKYGRGYSIGGRRRSRNIFFGGGGGFDGFGKGGGGGFSGGGGSFGGGGASGSW